MPPPPSGATTPHASPGDGGTTGTGTDGTGDGTGTGTSDSTRSLAAELRKPPPPGVGHTWKLLLAAVFTEPPLTHTQIQGTNDSVVDLLKTVPTIPVNVPAHPVVL